MRIKDYLKQNTKNKRMLVVSNVRRANALFRHIEKSEGTSICNTEAVTLTGLARRILEAALSQKGYSASFRYIDLDEATMLLRGAALKERSESESLVYFENLSLFESFATAREVLAKINLIRSTTDLDVEKILNDESLDGFARDRFLDLFRLLLDYEQVLAEGDGAGKKYLDNVAVESEAYKLLREKEAKDCLSRALGNCELAVLSEDKELFSDLQLRILEKIGDLLDTKIEEVSPFDKKSATLEDLDHLKDKTVFFKGYGSFNEAAYIANDILENKRHFGDVHILYASDSQIQPILAMLQGYGINVSMVSPVPSGSDPYISLAQRILDWAADRFSEKALCDVFAHPYLYYAVTKHIQDEAGNVKDQSENALNGWYYFQHVLDEARAYENKLVLGWGYERNRTFVNHVQDKLNKEKDKPDKDERIDNIIASKEAALAVHMALLDAFDVNHEAVNPAHIMANIRVFLKDYSRESSERKLPFGLLESAEKLLKRDSRAFELNEAIKRVKDVMESLSTKESEEPSCVTAERLSDWTVVNRPYLYAIGLSLKDLKASMIESPVMTDEEIEKYISGYKPTTKRAEEERKQSLYKTLALFEGEALSLGYSSYDSLAFFRSSPSTAYRELLGYLSDSSIDHVMEFTTGNPTEDVNAEHSLKGQYTFELVLPTSSSKMDTFLYCPREYAYENVYKIPDKEFREYDSSEWLKANERGSFFHSLAEEYVNKMLIKPASEAYDSEENEELIKSTAKMLQEAYKKEAPAAFPDITDTEVDEIVERACDYFYSLHQKLSAVTSVKRILAAEVGFKNAVRTIQDFNKNEYTITYRGFIDRIDYTLDSDNKLVRLYLVDYKTGKKSNQEKKVKKSFTMQHVLYANAIESGELRTQEGEPTEKLSDYILKRVADLEGNEEIKKWECKVDAFNFHFPMDIEGKGDHESRPVGITEHEIRSENFLDSRLEQILSMLSREKAYLDIYQMEQLMASEELSNEEKEYLSGFELDKKWDRCKNCGYKDMCPGRKVGVSK